MKKHAIAALLAAATLTLLASCGGAGGSQESGEAQQQAPREETTGGGMSGMDHGDMEEKETTEDVSRMDQEEMSSDEMVAISREMVMPDGEYSDKAFIDAMVPHHQGAVEMAQVALERAEHEEIYNVAEDIVSAQRAEIQLFGEIRERKYGSAESAMEMNERRMQAMGMSDPAVLGQAEPFDKAFIDEMIPHHESAIAMAEVAREQTRDPDIQRIAEDIVSAQKREIEKMRQWRQQWYPEG